MAHQKWKLVHWSEKLYSALIFFRLFSFFQSRFENKINKGFFFLIHMTSDWGIYFFYTLDNSRIHPFSYRINLKTVLKTMILV